jgi:hypothetical protein
MLPLRHRDLDHRDLVRRSVHDPAFPMLLQRLQRLDHLNGMDHLMLVHLFRCVVDIVNLNLVHRQDVEKMGVLQIRDEQNRDEVPTFQDEVRHFPANPVDEQVGVELRHLLKMDYFQDVEGVELRHPLYPLYLLHLLKMDCYQDEVLALVLLQPVLQVLQVHSHLEVVVLELAQQLQLLLLHERL